MVESLIIININFIMHPTLRPCQMARRLREISFSSLENFNSKTESRNQSPSIAVESIVQLTQKSQQNITHLHSMHKRYSWRNSGKGSLAEDGESVMDDQSMKENQVFNHENYKKNVGHRWNCQIKQRKIINNSINYQKFQLQQSPLKEKISNDSQLKNYFSNLSPIKDEQASNSGLKSNHERLPINSGFIKNQNQPPGNEHMKTTKSTSDKIQSQIIKLQTIILNLQKMKQQTIRESKQSCSEEESAKNSLANHRKQLTLSTDIHQQNELQSVRSSKQTKSSLAKSQIVNVKLGINEEDIKTPRLLNRNIAKSKKKLQENSLNPIMCDSQRSFNRTSEVTKPKINLFASKQTASLTVEKDYFGQKRQLKELLRHIQHQIKLDQTLRKSKKWFQKWHHDRKWHELGLIMSTKSIKLEENDLKTIFSINSEQQSPFYSPKNDDFSLSQLTTAYISAENYWNRNILGQFSVELLQKDSFTQENLDICKKGVINMEDFVRFVNFELDASYRNRDIFLIFRRISKGQPLYFAQLLECLSSNAAK